MSAPSPAQQRDPLLAPVRATPPWARLGLLALLVAASVLGWAWPVAQGPAVWAATSPQTAQEDPTPTLAPNTGAITGMAWQDINANGLREAGEPSLAGVLISLQAGGSIVATDVTGADGRYRLSNLAPGLYRLIAAPPQGYELTTQGTFDVFVSAGTVLTIDFGAQFVPTPTPTATPVPRLDTQNAALAWCGGVIQSTTVGAVNNVSSYACRPHWPETGPEVVYRIELNRTQTLTAALITATADLDLFLLRTSFPDSCVAAGDNYLTYLAAPGLYYLAVDGYDGAAGSFTLKVECPLEVQATPTPTLTPSPTPTLTPTPTPGPTATPTATPVPRVYYLPLVLRQISNTLTPPSTLVFQQGLQGYAGVADTTLSAWQPDTVLGGSEILSLRYNQQTAETTHMAPLLRFDLNLLPTNQEIISATLTLRVTQLERPEDMQAEVRGLLTPWRSETATWQQRDTGIPWNRPGAQGAGSDHMTWRSDIQRIDSDTQWATFDLTALVRGWSAQPSANYGIVILAQPGESDSNLQVDFASSEYAEISLRPKLTVVYRPSLAASRDH